MNQYYAILDTRSRTQAQADEVVKYYVSKNNIPAHRLEIIKYKYRYRVVRKIYEKDLRRKRGKFFIYGDVEEYRKHLIGATATVEEWLKRRRK